MQQSTLGHDKCYFAPMEITYQNKLPTNQEKANCSERKYKSAESTQIKFFKKKT